MARICWEEMKSRARKGKGRSDGRKRAENSLRAEKCVGENQVKNG